MDWVAGTLKCVNKIVTLGFAESKVRLPSGLGTCWAPVYVLLD